jgi:hypothetical protein
MEARSADRHRRALPDSLSATQETGGRWRTPHLVVGAVVIALAAGAVGVFIGRATKAGTETTPLASWQPVPKAPIAGRDSPYAVWTGKEMLVWGGTTVNAVRTGPCDRCASDGAAYNPATRSWRTIAPSPPGVWGGGAVWTGRELVAWASHSPDGPVGAAVYDLSTDSWRRLPAGPLGWREGYGLAWTGEELIVISGSLGDTLAKPVAAALDPRTGAWRLLPALNRIVGLYPPSGVAWDGRDVFVLSAICVHPSPCSPTLLAYNPATDALRKIDLVKAPVVPEQPLKLVAWDGTDLVFSTFGVASNVNSGKAVIVRYNPSTGRWRKGTFSPYPVPDSLGTQTAWLGDRYVVADGSSGLQIYTLATDSWQTITPGPSPLSYRSGSAIVWTGTDLIAWSGSLLHTHTGTPAANDGVSLTLKN